MVILSKKKIKKIASSLYANVLFFPQLVETVTPTANTAAAAANNNNNMVNGKGVGIAASGLGLMIENGTAVVDPTDPVDSSSSMTSEAEAAAQAAMQAAATAALIKEEEKIII
jgi:hypothetical protein